MQKSFRILMITLAATALVAGPAFAGPGGPGKENGDPDIPNAPLRGDLVTVDVADAPAGTSVESSSRVIVDPKADLWLRLFRAYFRLAKVFGP